METRFSKQAMIKKLEDKIFAMEKEYEFDRDKGSLQVKNSSLTVMYAKFETLVELLEELMEI